MERKSLNQSWKRQLIPTYFSDALLCVLNAVMRSLGHGQKVLEAITHIITAVRTQNT